MYETKMANGVLNELQVYRTKYFAGLVDTNMIENALMREPHNISNMLSYVFGTFENQSVLNYITGGIGRTQQIEDHQYQWRLMIENDKPVTILDAKWQGASIGTNDTPGLNGTPITIWTAEKRWASGAILECDDKFYQARVMSEPYQDGNNWVTTLQVADGQAASYIPPTYLANGSQLSTAGSAYPEGSDEADIISYQTPVMMRNHLTTMRLKYDITGSAYSTVMVITMRDPKTKKTTQYWADMQYWAAMRKWYHLTEYFLMYSRYNANQQGVVNLKGSNGRPVFIGAGLLQQIGPANRRYYTKLTVDLLEDFLFNMSYNVRGMGERKFLALSGEMGIKELDRVLRAKASSYTLVDTHFVSGSGQDLILQGQFTTYKMLNGVVLTIKHFPSYDNVYHNRKKHPVSGMPQESYRMTFINDSMFDGEPNIMKVVRKGREMVMWHTAGAVAPNGYANSVNQQRSHGKDSYEVNILGEQGIMIKNPTACGELILDIE